MKLEFNDDEMLDLSNDLETASESHKERIYKNALRKAADASTDNLSTEVSGVEPYRNGGWKRVLALAACVVLIGGGVIGSGYLISRNSLQNGTEENIADTVETTTEETPTEAETDPETEIIRNTPPFGDISGMDYSLPEVFGYGSVLPAETVNAIADYFSTLEWTETDISGYSAQECYSSLAFNFIPATDEYKSENEGISIGIYALDFLSVCDSTTGQVKGYSINYKTMRDDLDAIIGADPAVSPTEYDMDSKQDICFKMLNTPDYLSQVSGKMQVITKNDLGYDCFDTEFAVDIDTGRSRSVRRDYSTFDQSTAEKIIQTGDLSSLELRSIANSFSDGHICVEDNGVDLPSVRSANRRSVYPAFPDEERHAYDENGVDEWRYRSDCTNCIDAKDSLQFQELVFSALYDTDNWEVTENPVYLGRDCICIDGSNQRYPDFKMLVDRETGIILSFASYDFDGAPDMVINVTDIAFGDDANTPVIPTFSTDALREWIDSSQSFIYDLTD